MSLNRKVAHNTIVQIVGKIITTILGLVALGMMTRYLGQEKFGWYITAITFLQFACILIDFGLIPVTAQMLSEPEHDKTRLLKNLLSYRFFTAFICLIIAPFIAMFFPYPIEVKIAIAFSTISFLSVAMNQIFTGFYQTKLKMHIQVIGELVGRIVLVAGLYLLIKNHSQFLPIMAAIVVSSVSYTAVMWVSASHETSVGFGFDWTMWRAITKKMWPIALAIIFNVIYLKGDIILLSLFRPQAEVGLYGAAYRVIDIYSQLAMMIMGILLPFLAFNWSRNLLTEFRKHYQQSFDIIMLMAVPVLVATLILAEKMMRLVAGPDFAVAGQPLQILSLAVFGVYLGAVFGHTAVAINRQKQILWIFISDAIITLIGYLIFIPKFGMYGAAWMTVFSELYAGLLLFASTRYYSKTALQLKTFGKIILASLIMGFVLLALTKLNVLILVLIGAIVYGACLLLFKAISKETIREILSFKQKM